MVYVDYENRKVMDLANRLIKGLEGDRDKLERIFYYVRDNIKFGFLKEADLIPASKIIDRGIGQCNNKSILFQALNMAAGIESRIHFSSIKKSIQYGLFRGIFYKIMPKEISHSWIEVKVDNKWIPVDTYINDLNFFKGGKKRVKESGIKNGYSISCSKGEASSDFTLEGNGFSQMGAVLDSHGTYSEPDSYFKSPYYKNSPNPVTMFIYRQYIRVVNRRIKELRMEGSEG